MQEPEIETAQATFGERVTEGVQRRGEDGRDQIRYPGKWGNRNVEPELLKFRIRAKEIGSAHNTRRTSRKQGGVKKTEHRQRE